VVIRVAVFAILPVAAPSCVGPVDDVNQSFFFTGVVPVIILTDDVSILIKYKLMCVAQAVSKNFKVTAIGVGPRDHTAVRKLPFFSVGTGAVKADIADLPIKAPIRSHFDA